MNDIYVIEVVSEIEGVTESGIFGDEVYMCEPDCTTKIVETLKSSYPGCELNGEEIVDIDDVILKDMINKNKNNRRLYNW